MTSMSMSLQNQTETTPIQTSFTPVRVNHLQRKCACGGSPVMDGECAECRSKRLALQRRSTQQQPRFSTVPPIVHNVLRSPGQPLDHTTRAFMEPRFGHDFSQVRVHTNAQAADSAHAVNALAYTVGRDVVFGAGQYNPGIGEGKKLLAHELTHVVQQHHTSPTQGLQSVLHHPDYEDQFEREATIMSERVVAGNHLAQTLSSIAMSSLQRQGPTPSPSPRPLRDERFGLGRGGHRVDAELDRSICWLTLKMKVAFNFVDTPLPWPSPAHKTHWQNDFIRIVTNRWSFRYFLVPDRPCPSEPCRHVVVRIQVIPVTTAPHFTLNVGYTTSFRTSSVSGRTATLDWLDTVIRADIPQTPVEHEFGHMLGLPHVRCNTNDTRCYGVTSEEKANIMGTGAIVSARDYNVLTAVMNYFNGCNWHATTHHE